MRVIALLSAAVLAAPVAAPAQVVAVDAGTFRITRDGRPVGQETFTIRRSGGPGGDVYIASGTVEMGARRLSAALRADASGSPLAYQLEVREGATVRERLKGLVGRGRFSAQVTTPTGESTREYIVASGALVLDEEIFHQYYFLAQRAQRMGEAGGAVPVVVPRQNVQEMMRVRWAGADRLTIGGAPVTARVLVLTGPAGATRHIWVDEAGRVLKVELDGRGIVALRTELPR